MQFILPELIYIFVIIFSLQDAEKQDIQTRELLPLRNFLLVPNALNFFNFYYLPIIYCFKKKI